MIDPRRILWLLGAPARTFLIGGIKLYRVTLSSLLGGQCRFYPTCSHYGEEAIRVHGAIKGSALAMWRILRCHPFSKGGVEHVPKRRDRHARYEDVIQQGNA